MWIEGQWLENVTQAQPSNFFDFSFFRVLNSNKYLLNRIIKHKMETPRFFVNGPHLEKSIVYCYLKSIQARAWMGDEAARHNEGIRGEGI